MITITDINRFNSTIEIYGLSTDEKPVRKLVFKDSTYNVVNGSTFYEMDTKKSFIYDAENHRWLDV